MKCFSLSRLPRLRSHLFPALLGAALLLSLSPVPAATGTGPFAPGSDLPGGEGIYYTDPRIIGWATQVVELHRGYTRIDSAKPAYTTFGDGDSALGPADALAEAEKEDGYTGDEMPVVSLGDGGWITLRFGTPITNTLGPDFAVFENAFKVARSDGDYYWLELAFVEVSTNGTDFVRFPAISLTPEVTQIGSFGNVDPTNVYNLAGKDLVGYGTPFDLQELVDIRAALASLNVDALAALLTLAADERAQLAATRTGQELADAVMAFNPSFANLNTLDFDDIEYVRIVDVVGTINPLHATYDSQGHIVNDPWPTNFPTGGFDLDAVAVLRNPEPVPEPSALLLAGVAGLALAARRRIHARRAA